MRSVFVHPRFWWIAPIGGFGMGSFMAIQGLWAVPWLMEVEGTTRATAANHLLAMNAVIMVGYAFLGFFGTRLAHRGIHARHLFAAGFARQRRGARAASWPEFRAATSGGRCTALAPRSTCSAFTVLNEGFGRDLAGRTNTTLNLLMFTGSFVTQWGIGVVVDAARALYALDTAGGAARRVRGHPRGRRR